MFTAFKKIQLQRPFYRTHDFFFFFFAVKVWCLLLSPGFLFTPLCPDSLLALQFTLCGKQDRTLCWLSFQLAWIQTTNRTWQQCTTTATNPANKTSYMCKQSVRNTWHAIQRGSTRSVAGRRSFCNHRACGGLKFSLLLLYYINIKTSSCCVFAFVPNTLYIFSLLLTQEILLWFPWFVHTFCVTITSVTEFPN